MALNTFKSYVNEITAADVSIAMEHLLLAPEGTAWTPGRVNVSSPPAGFLNMGAVQEDSPQVTVNKGLYTMATGIPRVLQYRAVVDLSGEFSLVLHSNRNSRVFTSLGGIRMYHEASTVASPWSWVSSPVDRSELLVGSTAGVSAIVPGDLIVTDTSATVATTFNEAFVTSIAAMSGNTLYRVNLALPHGLPLPAVQSNAFYQIAHDRMALGTIELPFFRLLGVADFLNGGQVVHDMQKASPRGQFVEALRAGQDARVPGVFDLFGYTVGLPYTSGSELAVGERFYFSPTSPGL
jgi:hypothetical protein